MNEDNDGALSGWIGPAYVELLARMRSIGNIAHRGDIVARGLP